MDEPWLYRNIDDNHYKYAFDRQGGRLVICRPDRHVGCVLD